MLTDENKVNIRLYRKQQKKTKYYVNFSAKNFQKCRNLHFYQTVQIFQNDHLIYMYGIV